MNQCQKKCPDEYENPFVSSPNTCPIDVDKCSPDLYKMFNEKSDSLSNEIKSIKVNVLAKQISKQ